LTSVLHHLCVGTGGVQLIAARGCRRRCYLDCHRLLLFFHCSPNLALIFIAHGFGAHRGLRHQGGHLAGVHGQSLDVSIQHFRRAKLLAASHPAPRLDAEDAEIDGIALGRHDAIFADHAILLAAGNDFAGEKQQRPLGVVDQHQLVHLGALRFGMQHGRSMPPDQAVNVAILGDNHFAAAQPFIEGEKFAGGVRLRGNHGKYG